MTRKFAGALGSLLALAGVAAAPHALGVEHYLVIAPGAHLVTPYAGGSLINPSNSDAEWSAFTLCVTSEKSGSLRMAATGACNATGSTWKRNYVNLPWAPNPGSSETVVWSGSAPANTKLAGRAVSYNGDGTLFSVSGFVYGGGDKSVSVDKSNGAFFLEVAMQTSDAVNITPRLYSVAAQVYSN